jgi:predicted site-specific integrase-resolvase
MAEEKGCTMMARKRSAAIYVRVSTDKQTVENQVRELRQIAERRGWEVVEQYSDAGISGSKGRDDLFHAWMNSPGFNPRALTAASGSGP